MSDLYIYDWDKLNTSTRTAIRDICERDNVKTYQTED